MGERGDHPAKRQRGTRPARGYSRPPFEVLNVAALKHGAESERKVAPIAAALVDAAIEAAPWLSRPLFRWSVEAWARAEARSYLLDTWLDERATALTPGDLDEDGAARGAANLADKAHARAQSLRGSLGLDPSSMAKLLASFAQVQGGEDVLASLRAEGARLVAASTSPGALPPTGTSTAPAAVQRRVTRASLRDSPDEAS
jgi:hypothetical protein